MKLRHIKSVIALASILVFVACEKVVDIDLNQKDPQFVIEGMIIKGDSTQRLRITRTLNFNETEAYPVVNSANVTIVDDLGNSGIYQSIGDGWYELKNYVGTENRTYTVKILVDGKTFTASSQMPVQVPLETLLAESFPFGQDTFRAVIPLRMDPKGIANYYRFDIKKNDTVLKGVYIQDDQFSDGDYNYEPLGPGSFMQHDTVDLIMYCIDKPVWSYFNQLAVNIGGGASPANPTPMFTGGALGYFSACTKEAAQAIFP